MEDGISVTVQDCHCVEWILTADEKARVSAALLASSKLAYDL